MSLPGQLPADDNEDMSLRFDVGDASFVGNQTSNISLEAAHENLGYTVGTHAPIEHTEWYGANTGFLSNDGANGYVGGGWTRSYDMRSNDWSIVCWLQVKQTTKKNAIFWSFADSTPTSTNRIYLQYNSAFNRLIVNLRTNSQNFLRAIALHDNSSVSGITNSGTGWTTSQRGNVNGQNWTMLTITYDASASTPSSAFGVYWNATAFTGTTAQPNQGRTSFSPGAMYLMDLADQAPGSNNANFNMDEWKYFEGILPSSTVSSLYNSGVIRNNSNQSSAITLTQTEVSFDRHSDQAADTAGYFDRPSIQTGASRVVHQDATALNL